MSNIKLFESKQIRSVWNEKDQKWYFVVSDVVQILTETTNPGDYIKKIRKRDAELSKGWGQIVTPLTVQTAGGKQKLNCANSKGLWNNHDVKEQLHYAILTAEISKATFGLTPAVKK
jgi:prophage antirepressor-like protein